MRKKLIEIALPLEAINEASAREKSIRHGHPSTLHLWWARRPLAACRAVIFTSLVDDPDDPQAPPAFVAACRALPKGKNASDHDTPRMRLFDFIERLVTWEATTDEAVLETARQLIRLATDDNPPPLLDPFAGGGSIPLEAQRLGLEAHASDLNPVAVMINKALIEIPPKFAHQPPVNPHDRGTPAANQPGATRLAAFQHSWKGAAGLAADVRYYGAWMRDRAWERIGHLYPTYTPAADRPGETVIAWLWARTVRCPNPACGAHMPLVTSFELSKKKGRQAWVEPQIDRQTRRVTFIVKQGKGQVPQPPKVSRGANFRCLVCDEVAPAQHLKDEGMAGRMGAQLMAIVTEGHHGRNYHSPNPEHEHIIAHAQPTWLPQGELADEPRDIWCRLYGLIHFTDLFTPRQLVALTTFSDLVAEAREQIYHAAVAAGRPDDDIPLHAGGSGARAYAEAISVYLAFAIDKGVNYWSSLCAWHKNAEKMMSMFGRQALPMVWDYTEANPFSNSSGNFSLGIDQAAKSLESAPLDVLEGKAYQHDVTTIVLKDQMVVLTDPPYYDNIGYSDLSDLFYVWMRHSLQSVFPDTFSTLLTPKQPELIATPYRHHGSKEQADLHFERGLHEAFSRLNKSVPPNFPLAVFYAFKQSDVSSTETGQVANNTGWETMLEGLIRANFTIDGTWPIRTELTSALKKNVNALASSIVLVCRPRSASAPLTSRREFVNALRRELPAALHAMQSGNIAPVDLAQAAIGPGMAVYSRYSRVLEPNGDRLSVRTALQLINQALDEHLAEQEGHLDADSRFAVDWFAQFGFNQGEFGVADVLARAKNTAVASLVDAGIVEAGAGKVRLLRWDELDPGWDPTTDKRATIWEATHHLIERLHTHGEQGLALLLAKMPAELAAEARNLAYRLYSLCERKNWAEDARDYNALVISWSAGQEQAAGLRQNYQQRSLFQ